VIHHDDKSCHNQLSSLQFPSSSLNVAYPTKRCLLVESLPYRGAQGVFKGGRCGSSLRWRCGLQRVPCRHRPTGAATATAQRPVLAGDRSTSLCRVSPAGARNSGSTTTVYLCESYGGGMFWSSAHCNTQGALIERTATVPSNIAWDQKVAIAQAQRSAAEAAARPTPVVQYQNSGPTRAGQCAALNDQVPTTTPWRGNPSRGRCRIALVSSARQPGTSSFDCGANPRAAGISCELKL